MQGARILHSYGTLVKGLGCKLWGVSSGVYALGCKLWGVSPGVEVCSDDELDGGQVPGGGGGAGIGSVRFCLLVFACVRFNLLCMGFR
jgi:hypothetical protein